MEDIKKVVEKWSPIMTSLDIKDEDVMIKLCLYCEHHDNILNHSKPSILAASVKLLSTLDIKNKEIILLDDSGYEALKRKSKVEKILNNKTTEEFISQKTKISNMYEVASLIGQDNIEFCLTKEHIEIITKKIENCKKIYTRELISKLEIDNDSMIILSRFFITK